MSGFVSSLAFSRNDDNPLDLVESFVASKGWRKVRHDEGLMTVIVRGERGEYEICLEWQDEFSALLFACSLPIEIGEERQDIAARALEQINQNLWMGHFDLSNKGIYPTFRHTLLCSQIQPAAAVDAVSDVVDIAVAECNRFFSTFQLVQAGDANLKDNIQAAVFETVGEA